MSASTGTRLGNLPGTGAFFVGIAFILAATILNVAHDRLSGFKMDTLPLYIGTLYAATGKMGVTLLLVTLGVAALILGACITRPTRGASAYASSGPLAGGSQPYFCTGQGTATTAHAGGRVVLETWKYVTPPNGSPTQQ